MSAQITRLQATGWMGLEETDLALSPVTAIHGPNEHGKTRLLEALRMAITGKCGADRAVTLGGEGAELRVEADMDGQRMVILRQLNAEGKTDKLIVERGPEGQMKREKGKVQEFLNGLVRPYQVDILAFLGEKPADQRSIILSTVTDVHYDPQERIEGVDYSGHPLEVIAAEVDVLFRRRAKLNSDVENKQAFAAGAEVEIPVGFDPEVVRGENLVEKYNRLRAAQDSNATRQRLADSLPGRLDEIARLSRQVKDLQDQYDEVESQVEGTLAIDTGPLEADVRTFQEQQATLAIYDQAHAARAQAAEWERAADALTKQITDLRRRPAALLAQTKPVIEGLGVDAKGAITIHDLPITNLSREQQINLAIRVARATAGDLPLLLVDNLDALDAAHRALLIEEARRSGMQWIVAWTGEGELEVEYLEGEDDAGPEYRLATADCPPCIIQPITGEMLDAALEREER